MSEAEFRVYAAYYAREPSVGDRIDWWNARILAALLNPYRPNGRAPVRAESLCPRRWPAPIEQSTESVTEQVVAWGRAMAALGQGD